MSSSRTRTDAETPSPNGRAAAQAPPPAAVPRAFGHRLAAATEAAVAAVERSQTLDTLGQRLGELVSKVLRPGKVKDLLSGTWLGHPAHPMLTDVAIGSWTSALVLDVAGGAWSSDAAETLVGLGVLTAGPTALTGLSDLADLGTPPERALGAAHAMGNAVAICLFGASWLARRRGNGRLGTTLSLAGAAAMTGAAFLGGHLTLRKGIGVDHTAFEEPVGEWTGVLDEGELAPGEPRLVRAGGNDVMLYRGPGGPIVAVADRCNHAGGPLHEGSVHAGCVTCPWHASQFDLADGSVVRGPATAPQPSYETRVRDGKIEVRSRSRA